MKKSVLILLAGAFWLSAIVILGISLIVPDATLLRLAAIPDAILAIVFTAIAASRWVNDPPR